MPNVGRPSRDCHLCRSRRVKCDLTKPGCLRCHKYGSKCPGYRDEAEVNFQNKSVASIRKKTAAQRRAITRSREGTEADGIEPPGRSSSSLQPDNLTQDQNATVLSLPGQVPGPPADMALCLVLDTFTSPDCKQHPYGVMEFIPDIYTKSEASHCLDLVSDALAHAQLSKRLSGVPEDAVASRYLKALKATNLALSHPAEALHDSTMAAVIIFSIYEVQTMRPTVKVLPSSPAYHAHIHGLVSLIRLRGARQFETKRGRNLFWAALGLTLARCVVISAPCPDDCRRWLDHIRRNPHEEDTLPCLTYSYMIDAANLSVRVTRTLSEMSPEQARLSANNLIAAIGKLDTGVLALELHDSHVEASLLLNLYRSSRATLHQLVVFFTALAENGASEDEMAANLRRRREMSLLVVTELCHTMMRSLEKLHFAKRESKPTPSGVPEVIGWGDAMRMMSPLLTVANLPSSPPLRRDQAKAMLQRMAKELGITESFSEYA